jgi:hypothetical protein
VVEDRRQHLKPLDVGTVNLVATERNAQGQPVLRLKRNPFVEFPLDPRLENLVARLRAPHVVHGGKMYVVGEHAYKVAEAVNRAAPAPLNGEQKKADALPAMKELLGTIGAPAAPARADCYSSVPAGASQMILVQHSDLFEALLQVVSSKPANVVDGHSVAFSRPAEEDFKGIGIFCGGGLFDLCVAYKSLPAIFFSTSHGGEWVDIDVATDLGVLSANGNGHAESEHNEIAGYYRALVNNTVSNIKGRLRPAGLTGFPAPISILFSGATSTSGNFIELVRTFYQEQEASRPEYTTVLMAAGAEKPALSQAGMPQLSASMGSVEPHKRASTHAPAMPGTRRAEPSAPPRMPSSRPPVHQPPPMIPAPAVEPVEEDEEEIEDLPDAAIELESAFQVDDLVAAPERRIVDFRRYLPVSGRGLDVGTSNVVGSVRSFTGASPCNIQRNAFLDVRSDVFTEKLLMKLGVERYDLGKKRFVIGNPAFEFANIFEKATRRPMRNGVMSPSEQDAIFVESLVIRSVLGQSPTPNEICAYSIQADPIDAERNAVYHSGAIETILKGLGYAPRPILEGQAVVYAELADEDYTGIGISCGGGMFNICISYKSLPALAFSISRGGDWIDANVAQSLGLPTSQVCAIKESGVDLNNPKGRIEEAICIYYRNLIHYLIETIRERFETAQNMPAFRAPISVVCSGGTSMIKGFIDVFREEFNSINFPIPVKEIRRAKDPLRTVARGCLEAALVETKSVADTTPAPAPTLARADVSSISAAPPRPAPVAPPAAAAKSDKAGPDGKGSPWWVIVPVKGRERPLGGPACA